MKGADDDGKMSSGNDDKVFVNVPEPNKIVKYFIPSSSSSKKKKKDDDADDDDGLLRGAVYLYGNSSSDQIALCCAGFPDDHTIFQPFAELLAKRGNVFVGVMCLPGYDDRPDDGVSWTTHNPNGYTWSDWSDAVHNAVTVLRNESTYGNTKQPPKFTGIFHDWGTIAGSIYMNRALTAGGGGGGEKEETAFAPDNVVYLDVLLGPSQQSTLPVPKQGEYTVANTTFKQRISEWLYRIVLAQSFWLQRYVSKYVAVINFVCGFTPLELFGLGPLYKFDTECCDTLYQTAKKPRSLFRIMYMAYPYLQLFQRNAVFMTEATLHADWNKTPILYMYGTKKRTMFHDGQSIHMLQQQQQQQQKLNTRGSSSGCKVIPVHDAGHFLYVQKPDICVNSVLDFMKNN